MKFYLKTIVEIPKRVLSSPRGKFEYSSKCPLEIKSLIKEIKGSIEVSEIHSKKLFDLWSKLANKDSIKLPDVPTTKNHTSELNNSIQNVKRRSVYSPRPYKREANKTMIKSREFPLQSRKNDQSDNEVSDPKQLNFTSRVLDKEECQVNYKLINEKMKNKMMKTKFTKHTLFLFNPLKIRLRSPNSKRKNYLI